MGTCILEKEQNDEGIRHVSAFICMYNIYRCHTVTKKKKIVALDFLILRNITALQCVLIQSRCNEIE